MLPKVRAAAAQALAAMSAMGQMEALRSQAEAETDADALQAMRAALASLEPAESP